MERPISRNLPPWQERQSAGTSWLTQRMRFGTRIARPKGPDLKALYQGFITDASRLFVEAMSTKTDNIRRCLGAVASMHTSLNSNHKTP